MNGGFGTLQRLFGIAGLFALVSAGLALLTNALFFRALTPLLMAAIIGLYLWLQHSLPPRQGSLRIPDLHAPVDIYRDERGVPHIYAGDLHDLYMAQGFVTAQDRLWAMDLNRRLASGRLAEILGARLLPLDRFFRTVGLRRAAERSLAVCSPEIKEYLEAYAAGVNAWIAQNRLSPEFHLLGYRPEPWTPLDTLTIGKYIQFELGGNWAGQLFRTELVRTVGAEKAAELFWLPADPYLLDELENLPLPDMDELMNAAAATVHEIMQSSAWVAAGSKTRSGSPLLANDPHLAVRTPSAWYQAHLVSQHAGMDVAGASIPGVFGIILGQNREIAWGITNLNPDAQDIYLEKVHPENPNAFAYGSDWLPAKRLVEAIRVKGEKDPVLHEVLITRHGPVLARGEKIALSLRWTALEATSGLGAFVQINRARNWAEFRAALAGYTGQALNFLFAGQDGTIAWRVAGVVPVRAKGNGQAPLVGWSGEYEWTGSVAFEALPEAVNPPEGFIALAGQDITPEGYPFPLSSCWAPPYRARQIHRMLTAGTDLTPEKMLTLQTDVYNAQVETLVQTLLNAVQEGLRQGAHPEGLTPLEKRALLLLSGWDGEDDGKAAAPALWHQWYLFLQEAVFRPQMGLKLFDQFVSTGMAVPVTDRLLIRVAEGGESLWLGREGEAGLPRVALRSFRRAVALLAAKQGQAPENWRWNREHRIRFEHPLVQHMPSLRWLLNLGPYPVGGSGMTLHHQGYNLLDPFWVQSTAPWRQVVDLGDPEGAREVCVPGQSGHPMSLHYGDQIPTWLKGEAYTRLFEHQAIWALPKFSLLPRQSS